MPATVRTRRKPMRIAIPYGHPDTTAVYINEVEYTGYVISLKVEMKLNKLEYFEMVLGGITSSSSDVVYSKIVKIMSQANLIMKGRIESVAYRTDNTALVKGYGMGIKLAEREVARQDYATTTATNTIVSEVCSENLDGASPWVMDVGVNTNWGTMKFRGDFSNRLEYLVALGEKIGYDVWISNGQTGNTNMSPYDTDYLNFGLRGRGSGNSQMTFSVSGATQNAFKTSHDQNTRMLYNDVTVLGYGDGVNQIKTNFFNASATSTTLNESLTSSDTTITLTDASSFASSGTIRIAEEQISYTGKTGNNLTGCTRGASSTTAKAHPLGVFVEKHVAATSPEATSSISTYGRKQKTITDTSIKNDETAQLKASTFIMNRYAPLGIIKVQPVDYFDVFDNIIIGDYVTITDSDTGLSGAYRLVALSYTKGTIGNKLILEVSNTTEEFVSEVQEVKKKSDTVQATMQGSTVCYMTGETDNCDSSYPLRIDFFVPDEAVGINKIKLNYFLSKYRVWGSTAASDPSKRAYYLGPDAARDGAGTVTIAGLAPEVLAGGTWNRTVFIGNWVNKSGSNTDITLTFKELDDTVIGSASSGVVPDESQVTKIHNETSTDHSGDVVKLVVDGAGGPVAGDYIGFMLVGEDTHEHTVTYEIVEDSGAWSVTDITITVDGNDKTSDIETAKGSALSVDQDTGEDGTHMELNDYLSTPVAGSWHYVEIQPNNNCRIKADLFVQIFIESTGD